MSFTQLLYHIVFSTERRQPTIPISSEEELYRLMYHIMKREGCYVYKIGGIENHIHILVSLPANKTLAKIIQNLKRETSLVLGNHKSFPKWTGWNEGYGAFTCSWAEKESIIDYISNQKEHHLRISPQDEFAKILKINGYDIINDSSRNQIISNPSPGISPTVQSPAIHKIPTESQNPEPPNISARKL